jgi:phospholipid transport system substrate-binding protein
MQLNKSLFFVPALVLAGLALCAPVQPANAAKASKAKAPASASASDPAAVVKQVSSQIIGALNAHQDKLKGNPQYIQKLVKKYLLPHFDFDLTSQLVLGRYWRTASPEQRKDFKAGFLHYLTATYAAGLKHYQGGAKVKVMPFRGDASKRYVKVRSTIVIPHHDSVNVNYALVKHDDGWQLFDMIIEGVSYVRTYQTEFQSEIRHSSLDALIKRLQHTKAPKTLTAMKAAMPATAGGE